MALALLLLLAIVVFVITKRRKAATTIVIAFLVILGLPLGQRPAVALVDVGSDLHGDHDACIAGSPPLT